MTTTPRPPLPTPGELAILQVLWRRGRATVREVFEELGESRSVGYTTVLKLLQIMTDKGLVVRDEVGPKHHLYVAALPREATQERLVGDLAERAFGGSTARLVQQALSSEQASPEDLAEIRRLLDELARGER